MKKKTHMNRLIVLRAEENKRLGGSKHGSRNGQRRWNNVEATLQSTEWWEWPLY